ncbi:unnamed protein product [Penicillium manginii]
MFLTQMYGTILGGFINYAVMISIVGSNRELLADGNGNSSWSGATSQAYNTNAASWALAPYLYRSGAPYSMVPIGVAIGGAAVIVHRLFYQFVPKIGNFDVADINMAQFIQYAGMRATYVDCFWALRAVLSAELQAEDLQGLLISGYWCV